MTNMNPWQNLFVKCLNEAANRYLASEISSIDGVIDLFDKLVAEVINTREHEATVEQYLNQFVNVRDLNLDDKHKRDEV